MHLFTPDEVEMARRIWEAPNALHVSEADFRRGKELGLIAGNWATNLCNDVCHGHYHAKQEQ